MLRRRSFGSLGDISAAASTAQILRLNENVDKNSPLLSIDINSDLVLDRIRHLESQIASLKGSTSSSSSGPEDGSTSESSMDEEKISPTLAQAKTMMADENAESSEDSATQAIAEQPGQVDWYGGAINGDQRMSSAATEYCYPPNQAGETLQGMPPTGYSSLPPYSIEMQHPPPPHLQNQMMISWPAHPVLPPYPIGVGHAPPSTPSPDGTPGSGTLYVPSTTVSPAKTRPNASGDIRMLSASQSSQSLRGPPSTPSPGPTSVSSPHRGSSRSGPSPAPMMQKALVVLDLQIVKFNLDYIKAGFEGGQMWWSALTREIRIAEAQRQEQPNLVLVFSLKVCGCRSEAFIDRYNIAPHFVDAFIDGLLYAGGLGAGYYDRCNLVVDDLSTLAEMLEDLQSRHCIICFGVDPYRAAPSLLTSSPSCRSIILCHGRTNGSVMDDWFKRDVPVLKVASLFMATNQIDKPFNKFRSSDVHSAQQHNVHRSMSLPTLSHHPASFFDPSAAQLPPRHQRAAPVSHPVSQPPGPVLPGFAASTATAGPDIVKGGYITANGQIVIRKLDDLSDLRQSGLGMPCTRFHLSGQCFKQVACPYLHHQLVFEAEALDRYRDWIAQQGCARGEDCRLKDCLYRHPGSRAAKYPKFMLRARQSMPVLPSARGGFHVPGKAPTDGLQRSTEVDGKRISHRPIHPHARALIIVSEKSAIPFLHLRQAMDTLQSHSQTNNLGFRFPEVTQALKQENPPFFSTKSDDAFASYFEAAERNGVIKIIGRGAPKEWKIYSRGLKRQESVICEDIPEAVDED